MGLSRRIIVKGLAIRKYRFRFRRPQTSLFFLKRKYFFSIRYRFRRFFRFNFYKYKNIRFFFFRRARRFFKRLKYAHSRLCDFFNMPGFFDSSFSKVQSCFYKQKLKIILKNLKKQRKKFQLSRHAKKVRKKTKKKVYTRLTKKTSRFVGANTKRYLKVKFFYNVPFFFTLINKKRICKKKKTQLCFKFLWKLKKVFKLKFQNINFRRYCFYKKKNLKKHCLYFSRRRKQRFGFLKKLISSKKKKKRS